MSPGKGKYAHAVALLLFLVHHGGGTSCLQHTGDDWASMLHCPVDPSYSSSSSKKHAAFCKTQPRYLHHATERALLLQATLRVRTNALSGLFFFILHVQKYPSKNGLDGRPCPHATLPSSGPLRRGHTNIHACHEGKWTT